MKTKLLILISLILLTSSISFAQPGSIDLSFDPGTGANGIIETSAIQPDEKIIIAGQFTSFDGIERNRIARLNADGSLDPSFDPGTGANATISVASIQSGGKIIICGNFTSYNGTARNRIARLNSDGSLDNTFDPGTGVNDWVFTQSIQNDGKIIIGGLFTSYNGTAANHIARLNEDGSLDFSFDSGTGTNSSLFSTYVLTNGKIMIGGSFTSYNGTVINDLARLNTDGSLDLSFDPGVGTNSAPYCFFPQEEGKILIGGSFTSYGGTLITAIARVNMDGSLDTSFDPGMGSELDPYVQAILVQSDGKIIVGGLFTSYDGMVRNSFTRVNSDGSLDNSFDPGTGITGTGFYYPVVNTAHIQSDGKIIIGGEFNAYDGTPRNNIARVLNSNPIGISDPENVTKNINIFPNPLTTNGILQSNVELNNATFSIYSSSGQLVRRLNPIIIGAGDFITLNRDNLPAGLYFIQLLQDDDIIFSDKLVIAD